MSSKGPGSIPGHSTIFLCYQMNIKCPILTYKAEKPCLPFLPILPNRSFLYQSSSELRELSLSKFDSHIPSRTDWNQQVNFYWIWIIGWFYKFQPSVRRAMPHCVFKTPALFAARRIKNISIVPANMRMYVTTFFFLLLFSLTYRIYFLHIPLEFVQDETE